MQEGGDATCSNEVHALLLLSPKCDATADLSNSFFLAVASLVKLWPLSRVLHTPQSTHLTFTVRTLLYHQTADAPQNQGLSKEIETPNWKSPQKP